MCGGMSKRLLIWRIIDGKPGHENQSGGLVKALARLVDLECVDVRCDGPRPATGKPALLIGAGHRTHWKLLLWSWRYRARSVLLMKPSLPMRLFDLCLVPEHDLPEGTPDRPNLVRTVGVLNKVVAGERAHPPTGLILIGGPSGEFNWDGETLRKAIERIIREDPSITWLITDSRRTEPGFLKTLNGRFTAYPHAKTTRDWLPTKLAEATRCWVTEDSVSMIYEALTGGAQTGLLPMPPKGKPGRVARGIQKLVDEGRVLRFGDWVSGKAKFGQPAQLAEAQRCAELLARRFGLLQEVES